jgi:hypothetical protein
VTGEKLPNRANIERAKVAGTARSAKLTPERRSEIARSGALKRWGGEKK